MDSVNIYVNHLNITFRFLMFLKLFIGMGFLWVFEILAGICGSEDNEDEHIW